MDSQRARGRIERRRRHVHEVRCQIHTRMCREQCHELVAAAGPKLDHVRDAARARQHLVGVQRQQPAFGSRDAVPRQAADHFEQRQPDVVVEISRRQLPRRQREVIPDIFGERGALDVRRRWRSGRWRIHKDTGP